MADPAFLPQRAPEVVAIEESGYDNIDSSGSVLADVSAKGRPVFVEDEDGERVVVETAQLYQNINEDGTPIAAVAAPVVQLTGIYNNDGIDTDGFTIPVANPVDLYSKVNKAQSTDEDDDSFGFGMDAQADDPPHGPIYESTTDDADAYGDDTEPAARTEAAVWEVAPFDVARYNRIDYNLCPKELVPRPVRNKKYNRFMDILPNPNTRVPLQRVGDSEESEYYNANFVRGYDGTYPTYILAMGPIPSVVGAFWRLVWEQNVHHIVMATNLVEGGTRKCERYWPQQGKSLIFAGIQIEWRQELQHDGFLLTHIRLEKEGQVRMLYHYWFTDWPDHGVPTTSEGYVDAQNILELLETVNAQHEQGGRNGPILVHCSAGVGRSGVLVTIDHCRHLLQRDGQCDPNGVIWAVRQDRCALVQHPNQYEFLFQACLLYAAMSGHSVTASLDAVVGIPGVDVFPETKRSRKRGGTGSLPNSPYNTSEEEDSSDEEDDESDLDSSQASSRQSSAPASRQSSVPASRQSSAPASRQTSAPTSRKSSLKKRGSAASAAPQNALATDKLKEHEYASWFHGVLSRDDTEALFARERDVKDGTWLVRESSKASTQFALSMFVDGKVFHHLITLEGDQFRDVENQYDSLVELVEHHKKSKSGFRVPLADPIVCPKRRNSLTRVRLGTDDYSAMALPANKLEGTEISKRLQQIGTRRSGWLTKQGAGRSKEGGWQLASKSGGMFARKNWKKRWFVLQDSMVKYFKEECSGSSTALGYINLSADTQVNATTDRSFSLCTPRREYKIYCDTPEDARGWIDSLQAAVARARSAKEAAEQSSI
eukprot:m.160787 g.160787  ORF g.160787 m.160787 type:complete len:825 (+) comp17630_c0_seq7:1070-3544(+)